MANAERRQHQRVPFVAQVECVGAAETFQAEARDVSTGGLFLKTEKHLARGVRLRVFLAFEVINYDLEALAEVAYPIPGMGVGCSFVDLADPDRKALESFIATRLES